MWDVFISHASEDKAAVAAPLAVDLQNHCLRVWLDQWVLSPGDSLRRKIDEGISKSRLGVVVLSHPFFAKAWPQAELDALYTLALSGKRSIVPVWHDITADEVTDYSPLLAAVLALSTSGGIERIAEEIALKLGCKGRPLAVEVGPGPAVVPGVAALAAAIRSSEDIPGSYSGRRVTVSFSDGATSHGEEIRQGVRQLITQEPLTYPVRTSDLLATCLDSFVRLYSESASRVTGTRLDLWLKEDTTWHTGIYVTPEESSHIAGIIGVGSLMDLRSGFPNDMLDLGASVLATKAIPQILFEFLRRQQRDSRDYTDRTHELLSLRAWTFGIG